MIKKRKYDRFRDFQRASARLDSAIKMDITDDIIYDGIIQRFEFTFELG